MTHARAHRAGELADMIEKAYTEQPAGTGTKIDIKDGDWPLMVEALRICESLLKFEADQEANSAVADRTEGNHG